MSLNIIEDGIVLTHSTSYIGVSKVPTTHYKNGSRTRSINISVNLMCKAVDDGARIVIFYAAVDADVDASPNVYAGIAKYQLTGEVQLPQSVTASIPANYYYKVELTTSGQGTASIAFWNETDIG